MLAGVLLDVVKPAGRVDCSMHRDSCSKRLCGKMQDTSIFLVRDVRNSNLLSFRNQQTKIVHLSAAGGIKSCAVEHDGMLPLTLDRLQHTSIKVVEKRIVVIEPFGHTGSNINQRSPDPAPSLRRCLISGIAWIVRFNHPQRWRDRCPVHLKNNVVEERACGVVLKRSTTATRNKIVR